MMAGCTAQQKPTPSLDKYSSETQMMTNICQKFATEPDAQKLHKAAVATQSSRVIACADYNGECELYGKCLALVISASADGNVSGEEQSKINQTLSELRKSIKEGLKQLRK